MESGSRTWGFASPDSDYDVRFIYVQPRESDLRLERVPDGSPHQTEAVPIQKQAYLPPKGGRYACLPDSGTARREPPGTPAGERREKRKKLRVEYLSRLSGNSAQEKVMQIAEKIPGNEGRDVWEKRMLRRISCR